MIENELAMLLVGAAFGLGVAIGEAMEAKSWRASAGDYLKRESGGRTYVVREDVSPTGPYPYNRGH